MSDTALVEKANGFLLAVLPGDLWGGAAERLPARLFAHILQERPSGLILNAANVGTMDAADLQLLESIRSNVEMMAIPVVICGLTMGVANAIAHLGGLKASGNFARDVDHAMQVLECLPQRSAS